MLSIHNPSVKLAIAALAFAAVMLCPAMLSGATIRVPQEQPNIQAGIDAAVDGDLVLVASGSVHVPLVYEGPGNRDLDFHGKSILLISESGTRATVINCQGSSAEPHIAVNFHSDEDSNAVINGFTITGAYPNGTFERGAVECNNSAPTIENCIFIDNNANGIHAETNAYPHISECYFVGNTGNGIELGNPVLFTSGGTIDRCLFRANDLNGIFLFNCDTLFITNCTLVGNGQNGIHLLGDMPKLERLIPSATFVDKCISAFNGTWGIAKSLGFHGLSVFCCDAFENTAGNFAGVDTFLTATYGNFSADPLFCSLRLEDFGLNPASPCAPDNNSCGALIGAFDIGCSVVCGDADGSGIVTVSDAVFLIHYIFANGPAPVPLLSGDTNCTGRINISDAVTLINYIFSDGLSPCANCE